MGRTFCPFPVCCPRDGGMLQAPLCPPPRLLPQEDVMCTKEIRKEKKPSGRERQKKEAKKKLSPPPSLLHECHERGRGRERW